MNLRSRFTYANVVATLALVLAIGGGTVYAALRLGKDSVHSKNIAAGAVKKPDLGKNAVTSPKVKNGAIKAGDIAAGVIPMLDADVTGSANAGPQGNLNTDTVSPLPLRGTTTFTPRAGDVSAIVAEGRFTFASTSPTEFCGIGVGLFVNGEQTRISVSPENNEASTTLVQGVGRDADGPFGLLDPGEPLTITAKIEGDVDCTANTQLDRLEIKILQIR